MAKTKHFINILGGMIIAFLCPDAHADESVTAYSVWTNKITYELSSLIKCRENDIKSCLNWTDAMNKSRQKCSDYGFPKTGSNACTY
ncbi:MAG: hypothetical protein LBG89_00760 [Rickettsiales bacterium]|jgi:hypothetical protein|nr:hypothetical protein [Rickettsiales bacterium]